MLLQLISTVVYSLILLPHLLYGWQSPLNGAYRDNHAYPHPSAIPEPFALLLFCVKCTWGELAVGHLGRTDSTAWRGQQWNCRPSWPVREGSSSLEILGDQIRMSIFVIAPQTAILFVNIAALKKSVWWEEMIFWPKFEPPNNISSAQLANSQRCLWVPRFNSCNSII